MQLTKKQCGFTITEILIGLAVGLMVMLGVTSVYMTTLETSGTTLQSSRLNQEMSAIMNIMVNDIRRAGYWGSADFENPQANPFNQIDATTPTNTSSLRVHETADNGVNYTDNTDDVVAANRNGSCITYTYDSDGDGVLDDTEKFGFRWDQANEELDIRRTTSGGANNCVSSNANSWEAVTDPDFIEITNLNFDLRNSKCNNNSEPDDIDEDGDGTVDEADEYNCYLNADNDGALDYAPDSGERTVESFEVTISLTAALVDDPDVQSSMTQTVKVRNYLVRDR